jgi:hypothetical protein
MLHQAGAVRTSSTVRTALLMLHLHQMPVRLVPDTIPEQLSKPDSSCCCSVVCYMTSLQP